MTLPTGTYLQTPGCYGHVPGPAQAAPQLLRGNIPQPTQSDGLMATAIMLQAIRRLAGHFDRISELDATFYTTIQRFSSVNTRRHRQCIISQAAALIQSDQS